MAKRLSVLQSLSTKHRHTLVSGHVSLRALSPYRLHPKAHFRNRAENCMRRTSREEGAERLQNKMIMNKMWSTINLGGGSISNNRIRERERERVPLSCSERTDGHMSASSYVVRTCRMGMDLSKLMIRPNHLSKSTR